MGRKYYFIITWVSTKLLLTQNIGKLSWKTVCSSLFLPSLISNLGISQSIDQLATWSEGSDIDENIQVVLWKKLRSDRVLPKGTIEEEK